MDYPQSQRLVTHLRGYGSKAVWLVSLLVLLTGCSPSRKKEAQNLVKLGIATSEQLADYYDGLVKQNESFLSLYMWQKATEGTISSLPSLYRFVPSDFEGGGKPFVLKLKTGADPFASYVTAKLPASARQMVMNYRGTRDLMPQELDLLRRGLNDVLLMDPGLMNDARKAFVDERTMRYQQQMADLRSNIRTLEQRLIRASSPSQQSALRQQISMATGAANQLGPRALRSRIEAELIASASSRDGITTQLEEDRRTGIDGISGAPVRNVRRMRLNRFLLDSAFSEELGTSIIETLAIQNALLNERGDLARNLGDLYTALGKLVDYDASSEVRMATLALGTEIETLNHHPLTLGNLQSPFPKEDFGDLAAKIAQAQRTREVRKNAPLVQEVLHATRAVFDDEKQIYTQISARYFAESRLIADRLVAGKRDVSGLSFLQPAIAPYNLQLLQRAADDPQTTEALTELISEKADQQKREAKSNTERLSQALKRLEDALDAFMNKNRSAPEAR